MGKVPRVREDLARICSDLARRKAAEGHRTAAEGKKAWGVNGVISARGPFTPEVRRRPICGNGVALEITPFTPGQRGGRSARKRKAACSATKMAGQPSRCVSGRYRK